MLPVITEAPVSTREMATIVVVYLVTQVPTARQVKQFTPN